MPVIGANAFAPVVAPGGDFDGVVNVNVKGLGGGTGTLLASGRHILTAAHVVDSDGTTAPGGVAAADALATVRFDMIRGANPVNINIKVPAAFIAVQGGWQGSNNINNGNDVAILPLTDQVTSASNRHLVAPFGAQRYAIFPGANEVGQNYTVVGYGETGTGNTGEQSDEVQRVSIGSPVSGGTFTLTFNGQTTAAIPQNANSQTVAARLQALTNIGQDNATPPVANVVVSNAGLPANTWDVRFVNQLGYTDVNQLTGAATGGATVNVTTQFNGNINGVKRQGQNRYDVTAINNTALRSDWDNGVAANDALGGNTGPDTGFAARGDSGGPEFIRNTTTNTWEIATVVSFTQAQNSPPDINNYVDGNGVVRRDNSFGEARTDTRLSSFNGAGGFIPTTLAGSYHLVLDMNQQVLGLDGMTENLTIIVRQNGTNLEIEVVNDSAPGIFAGVYYSAPIADILSLTLRGGADNETFRIDDNVPALTIDAGAGNDKIIIRGASPSLTIDGGDGSDTITIQQNVGGSAAATIKGGKGNDTINIQSGIPTLSVDGGEADDTINIENLPGGSNTTITGGDGYDQFFFSPKLESLNNIRGTVIVDGTNGASPFDGDNLVFYDAGSTSRNRTYTLSADTLTTPGKLATITYRNVGRVYLDASPADNTTVNIYGTSADTSTQINGAAIVNVGAPDIDRITPGKRTRDVAGPLDIFNLFRTTALTIDDTAGGGARTVDLTPNYVYGMTAEPIWFGLARLSSLTINAGSGGNTFTVHDTRTSDSVGPITLRTGAGVDTVNIEKAQAFILIDGQRGRDTVNFGLNGSMQGITAPVQVLNKGAWSTLNLDDSADTVTRQAIMNVVGNYGTVSGLAPAVISYRKQDLAALNVWGGSGNNTFDVVNTAQSTIAGGSPTTLYGGSGFDTINVLATTGPLFIDPQNNYNQITIGGRAGEAGSLSNIRGDITLRGQEAMHGNFVDIIDRASTGRYAYHIDNQRLYRTSRTGSSPTASIYYSALPMDGLDIVGANRGNLFQIDGTPTANPAVVGGGVNVITGDGSDAVTVFGASPGQLNVFLGSWGSGHQSITIGDATHSLDDVRGAISVSGDGPVDAFVSNAASAQSQVANIRSGTSLFGPYETLERTRFVTDHYDTLNQFSFFLSGAAHLHYYAGQASDTMFLHGSPANFTNSLFGGASADYFWIEVDQPALLGPVFVDGGPANNDNAFYYDYLNTSGQTYRFLTQPSAPNDERVERTGAAPVTYRGLGQIIFYAAHVGGNTVNVRALPKPIFLNMVAAPNDVFTLGSKAPGQGGVVDSLLGPISVTGIDHVRVIVDDSGSLTPRQVTVKPKQDAYGDFVTGLVAGGLYTRLDDTSSLTFLGGQGNDSFAVNGAAFVPAVRIDGGGGVNTLDFSQAVNIPGLVSWYKGEGNYQDAFGGNHASLYSTATFVPGKVGQAFRFDSTQDQYVQVTDVASLQPATVSVEAWVNSTQVARNAYLVAKGASNNTAASYALYTGDTSGLSFYVYNGAAYIESPNAGAQIWDGQWHHVVGTYDGANVRLYVDGAEVGQGTPTNIKIAYNLPTSNDLIIGNFFGTGRHPFNGLIDEPAVFSRALTAQDVQKHYAAGAGGLGAVADGVSVNLPLGTATGLRGGIAKIQNVTGSAFNDILVGNGGNVLNGGAGRDLLIAGATASSLYGGDGEDLLIGGTTVYDNDPAALDALMAEWARTDSYDARATKLRNGLLAAGKVSWNRVQNTLYGQGGLDLFFGNRDVGGDLTDWVEGEAFFDIK